MIERLEAIEKRYNELNELLMSNEVISDIKKTLELTKEQASLKDGFEIYNKYKTIVSDIEAAKEMAKRLCDKVWHCPESYTYSYCG